MAKNWDRVLYYFEEISKIPRCSGNEEQISNFLKSFAQEHQLEVHQDELGNIVIKKPATAGYEDIPGVILQGHMDMVCEKSTESTHDFSKDPIELIIEGDILRANQTTLGADDGIAIAMALAIAESDDIPHPALEILVTVSEETDMSGALGLSDSLLQGTSFINIDSEEEGILTVGSAGGSTLFATHPIKTEASSWPQKKLFFDGFKGGHSGMEINQNRGNMLKVMAYFLDKLEEKTPFRIARFTAGTLDNAIPRSGEIIIAVKEWKEDVFQQILKDTKEQFKDVDGALEIQADDVEEIAKVWAEETAKDLLNMIQAMPQGVNTLVEGSDLVESSNNLALVKVKDGEIYLENSLRSSNLEVHKELSKKCTKVFEENHFKVLEDAFYPGWEYNPHSPLRDLAEKVYKEVYGKDFETLVIHAGLECGAISAKYPQMDMISIGPNITGAHTPKESMEISSAQRVYEYILELLKSMA